MSEPDIGKKMYYLLRYRASSVDDVEDYMAYWYVRNKNKDWTWPPHGPERTSVGDRDFWQTWVRREVDAKRVRVEYLGAINRYTFTEAWFNKVAHIIMRYELDAATSSTP